MKKNEGKISLLSFIIGLVILIIIVVIIGLIIVTKKNDDNNEIINNTTNTNISENETSSNIVENTQYLNIGAVSEDVTELLKEDGKKIEDTEVIEKIEAIINSGKEHQFNNAFGVEIHAFIEFYLKSGDKVTVYAIDQLEMEGEESGNYIMVYKNDNENEKKIYKTDEAIAAYIQKVYNAQ